MKQELIDKANKLPLLPGVYMMKDNTGTVIYVGKAKKLKNRVSSYFHGEHTGKVSAMIEKIHDFEVILVNSELEALVLENSLIKQYRPRYNILLKDDKGYPFIRIAIKEEYPDITISAKKKEDGAQYFGPFGGRKKSFGIISEIKGALQLPDCRKKFPRDIGSSRPCLNYHLHKCLGWCSGIATQEEYRSRINEAVRILEGKGEELTRDLREQMEAEAELLNFEKAAELRDRVAFLSSLQDRQLVLSNHASETDAIGFSRGSVSCFSVIRFINGTLVDKNTLLSDEPVESDEEAVLSFAEQYYTSGNVRIPPTILAGYGGEAFSELENELREISGKTVHIENPSRGEKRKLLAYAEVNAREEMKRVNSREQQQAAVLQTLMKHLSLHRLPERIEAYDISNLGNEGIVAAMTVFVNGKPEKKEYRKFRIKSLSEQNDYASLAQCLERRFTRFTQNDPSFSRLPDLILIDGGDRHARIAQEIIRSYALDIEIYGMVKDDRHRTRALVTPDGLEVNIRNPIELFSFFGRIQEETHRSAISYQRYLRKEKLDSVLDAIPGIGKKRKSDLLEHFHTIKAIREASQDELSSILPSAAALSVYQAFHQQEKIKEEKE